MKVAAVQVVASHEPGGGEAELAHVAVRVREAAGCGARLIVLPEHLNHEAQYRSPEAAAAFSEPDGGPWQAALASLARECGAFIAAGHPEWYGALAERREAVAGRGA